MTGISRKGVIGEPNSPLAHEKPGGGFWGAAEVRTFRSPHVEEGFMSLTIVELGIDEQEMALGSQVISYCSPG